MLIGLIGRLKSGKDTAGRRLTEKHGFSRYAFADILKELCSYAVDREDLGWDGENWIGSKTPLGRQILQGIGHGAREVLGPDVWVDAMAMAIAINQKNATDDDIVITDVRYLNEAEWVKRRGGLLIRINRPDVDRSGPEHQHPTEANVDNLPADIELTNDATIGALWEKMDAIVAAVRATKAKRAA